MTVLAIGFIPAAPLLIPALAGADTGRDHELRSCVRSTVAAVVAAAQSCSDPTVVVVGLADEASTYDGTWDFAPLGLAIRGPGTGRLPTPLGIGAWFLDEAAYTGQREYVGVPDRAPAAVCAALGASLAQSRDVALLVVGDGSARRDEKAPGWLDPRAAEFDAAVIRALAAGQPEEVLALDPDIARDLLAAGRAPWQAAAGAARGSAWVTKVLWDDAPYGVGYVVATWLTAPSA